MKKLLIVTDHRFYKYNEEIYDNYVFDYNFFKEYLGVFDTVTVIARVKEILILPKDYSKTSGEKLNFITIKDERGANWIYNNSKYLIDEHLSFHKFSAVCFRIPSILSYSVYKKMRNLNVPMMFEFIGDPKESLINKTDSFLKRKMFSLIGDVLTYRMRKIVAQSKCGSYVSFNHLQKKFPANPQAKTDTISSIRLDSEYIINNLNNLDLEILKIIHVGSFVPIKNQDFLINFVELLQLKGVKFEITFLGDGDLLKSCKNKVSELNLVNKVNFEGHISGFDNIVSKLDKHNIFILPSYSEGMPRAMIEAMARGLICFGADRGGIKELLDENFTFEPDDVHELYSKLFTVIQNLEKLEINRIENLEKVKLFEKSNLSKRRIQLLNHLISK